MTPSTRSPSSETSSGLSATNDDLALVCRVGFFGLISYGRDGRLKHHSYVSSSILDNMDAHEYFIRRGWQFVAGDGYYDKDWNRASAYFDGFYVPYPDWD